MSRQPPPAVPRAQLEAFRGRASCVAGALATLQAKSQTAIEFLKNHLVKPLQASGKDVSGVIEALNAIAQSLDGSESPELGGSEFAELTTKMTVSPIFSKRPQTSVHAKPDFKRRWQPTLVARKSMMTAASDRLPMDGAIPTSTRHYTHLAHFLRMSVHNTALDRWRDYCH